MIFATIGTQLPFDRFIRILDNIAPLLHEEIVAQVHHGNYQPKSIKTVDLLPPDEFEKIFNKARLIVAHAGMGTILSALQQDKPIILFPRIAALGEHRNEHQLATAKKIRKRGWVYVATEEDELKSMLLNPDLRSLCHIGDIADDSLIESLTDFIENTSNGK